MNKVIFKEPKGVILGVDIMFYCVFIMVGIIILNFTYLYKVPTSEYAPTIFYVLGFFSILSYFLNRKRDDYEFLMLGIINIIVGAFVYNNSNYFDYNFILANAINAYTLAVVFSKLFVADILLKNKNIDYYPKIAVCILLIILGSTISIDFGLTFVLENILLGYYFLTFGIVCLFEPLLILVIRNTKVSKYLNKLIGYVEPKNNTKKIKEVEVKKPVKKIKVEPKKPVKNDAKKVVKKTTTKKNK